MNNNDDFDFDGDERGCGFAQEGGTYMCVGMSENGIPIEYLFIDPVVKVPQDFGMKKMGFTLKERTTEDGSTVYDVFDHIGESGYPYPTDWIEEVKRMGFHQKIDPSILKYLDPERSKYYATHSKAWYPHQKHFGATRTICTKNHPIHDDPSFDKFCIHRLWESIPSEEEPSDRIVKTKRQRPSFEYLHFNKDQSVDANLFEEGIFMCVPVKMMSIRVYEDTSEAKKDEKALEIIKDTKFAGVTKHVKFEEYGDE